MTELCGITRLNLGLRYHLLYFFRAFRKNCERRLLASSCPFVRPSAWNNSAPTGRISMKFCILSAVREVVEKIKLPLKSDKKNGYFTWRPKYIYDISANSSYNKKNVSDENCKEKSKHTFCAQKFFLRKSCHLWDNMKNYGRSGEATDFNIRWRTRFAWLITKVTDTQCNNYCF